jgi:hypothetical protein
MYHVRRRVVLADVVNSGTFDFRNGKDTFLLGWENRDGGRITLSQEAAAIFELTNSRGAKVDVEEVVGVVLTNVVNYEGASIGVTPLQSAAEDPFIELNELGAGLEHARPSRLAACAALADCTFGYRALQCRELGRDHNQRVVDHDAQDLGAQPGHRRPLAVEGLHRREHVERRHD